MRTIQSKISLFHYITNLFAHVELLKFFVIRDVLVRYRLALLGIMWALIRPLLNMVIFVILFDRIAHLSHDGINYPLFVLSAMIPWQLISSTMQSSVTSLTNHSNLITKIYFPKMLLPLSSVAVNCLDLLITYSLFFPWYFWVANPSLEQILFFPLPLFQTILLAVGIALWFSALSINFRDIIIACPFLAQIGLFISPVGYDSALFPAKWQWLYQLNPMCGVIDSFRYALFGTALPEMTLSWCITLLFLGSGVLFFKRTERRVADLI